jgi:hypothetical protein
MKRLAVASVTYFSDTKAFKFDIISAMKRYVSILSAFFATVAVAERQPFERYQSVVDRQMFGALPHDFDPSKMPSDVQKTNSRAEKELLAEQEKLKSAIHFSVINVRKDGKIEVGFTDNTDPKEPCHYFICEGESSGGWTVESADPEKAAIVLEKDGVTLELTLGDNSAKGGGSIKRREQATSAQKSPLIGGSSFRSQRSLKMQRLAEESKKIEEERQKMEAARQKAAAEAAEKEAVREKQREEERAEHQQRLAELQETLKRVREEREAGKKGESNETNVTQ